MEITLDGLIWDLGVFNYGFGYVVLNRLVQFNVIRHYVETNLFPYYS